LKFVLYDGALWHAKNGSYSNNNNNNNNNLDNVYGAVIMT